MIAPSAVRWYADQGLLPCERVIGDRRRFFADVLCRVAMLPAAQKVGLSLAEMPEVLNALPTKQAPTRQDWARLAARLRTELTERVEELFALLGEMTNPRRPGTSLTTAGRPEQQENSHHPWSPSASNA